MCNPSSFRIILWSFHRLGIVCSDSCCFNWGFRLCNSFVILNFIPFCYSSFLSLFCDVLCFVSYSSSLRYFFHIPFSLKFIWDYKETFAWKIFSPVFGTILWKRVLCQPFSWLFYFHLGHVFVRPFLRSSAHLPVGTILMGPASYSRVVWATARRGGELVK